MEIGYEVTLADCLALNSHLMKTSPLMLKTIRKGQLWWASGPLVGGTFLSIFKGIPLDAALIILLILGVAISLPMFFLYPLYFKNCNKKYILKVYKSGNNKGVLGVHEMIVSDECLIEKTEFNDSKIQWNSINKIDSTTDHTFIFTGDLTAYTIPHKNIISGDYAQFVEKLKETFNRNGSFQPGRCT